MGVSVKKIIKEPCGISFYRSIECCFNSGFNIWLPFDFQITPLCKPPSNILIISHIPFS